MAPGWGSRVCARPDCARAAAAALTYDYAASTVWVDEMGSSHPSSYDLCAWHADRITVPHGWQLLDSRGGASNTAPAEAQAAVAAADAPPSPVDDDVVEVSAALGS
jgi:hypothetical protein